MNYRYNVIMGVTIQMKMTSQHQVMESELKSFFVYCPELGTKEGTEERKILYYSPDSVPKNRKIRNIGLCEAFVNFTKTFSPDKPCEYVHTQKTKQVFLEPEAGIWMVLTVTVPFSESIHNSERVIEYHENFIQESILQAALKSSYLMFKLFNGTFRSIQTTQSIEGLKKRLDMFYSRYWRNIDPSGLDIFSVFQGIQFLPLDKYMYLKVHCFVNLVETTFRNIKRSIFVCGDQLVWSGLEPEDTKIFYQYLSTWLLRNTGSYESSFMTSQSVTASVTGSSTAPTTGCFVTGDSESEGRKSVWVYVNIDQQLTPCRLYIYSAGMCSICMFVQNEGSSPSSEEFPKRLGIFLGPRLSHLGSEIKEFVQRSRTQSQEKLTYKMVYFNEMNLAIKSPLMTRRSLITSEMMCLLTQVNSEYDKLEEGETVIRTMSDYWVVARKNGHRRFFVLITQKDVNFAEVNEEVRKICQKEFSNIYFFD